ncbi:MAG: hypothetical protein K0R64_1397 [Novosphingobium lindaniclasticum]|nr:hypothetical protein [Novosphingobium lindaniclasticum]
MKRNRIERAAGHAIPGNSNSVPDQEFSEAGDHAKVVRLEEARAARDASGSDKGADDGVLPVGLAIEAMRFRREPGFAGLLASDGPWAGRLVQFAIMAIGVTVAIWAVSQMAEPGLGAGEKLEQSPSISAGSVPGQ